MKCEECGKKIRMVLWLEVGHDPECPRYDFKDAPERIEIKVTREESDRDELKQQIEVLREALKAVFWRWWSAEPLGRFAEPPYPQVRPTAEIVQMAHRALEKSD